MANRQYTTIMIIVVLFVSSCSTPSPPLRSKSSLFDQPWNSGLGRVEPPLQVQFIDQNTVAIRQSLKTSFEAPFIFLIFGEDKVLLIDTGAGNINLRTVIDELIAQWLEANNQEGVSLVIMHTHGHGDHVSGDEQFTDRSDTKIVGHGVTDIIDFFGIQSWPNEIREFDLGGRVVDLIPTPGHHDTHIMVYDRLSRLLFSGDVLYPGRLYFQCGKADEFKRSIDRVAEFMKTREVNWLLGAHIELAVENGRAFGSNDRARKDERLLEMPADVVLKVQAAMEKMNAKPRVEAHDDFILFPHPADPRGKSPPDWCLNQS